ncbi:hypothetical protein ACFPUS_004662 [Salmonella enterica]
MAVKVPSLLGKTPQSTDSLLPKSTVFTVTLLCVTIVLPSFTNLTDLANHPGLRMPRAATSWASCLFAVDELKIALRYLLVNSETLIIVFFY